MEIRFENYEEGVQYSGMVEMRRGEDPQEKVRGDKDSEEVVAEMLREDERRMRSRVFNPQSGAGAPGERMEVKMNCPVLGGGVYRLPKTMLTSELGRSVMEKGSVSHFARERGLAPERVGELFELVRLRHDFPYWASKYGLIRPKTGGENKPLTLNNAQRKLVDRLERIRCAGEPIRVILLKARQWGGSTVIQLYMVWLQLVVGTGLNSLTVAHQNAATEEIRAMMKRVVDEYLPELMRVDFEGAEKGLFENRTDEVTTLKSVGRSGNTWTLPARNCDFKIGTAERPDSSRGGAYSLIHLSEVGIWRTTEGRKPSEIVISTTSGVLARPNTMIVLESTAKGKGSFFHKEYEAAKKGKAQWTPFFISWFDIEQYSMPVEDKEEFARRLIAGRFDAEKDDRAESGSYLWRLWESGATLEAINWYIWERRKYDSSSAMASEYPSDDVEAFASSGNPVFGQELLDKMEPEICEPDVQRFGRMKIEKWLPFRKGQEYIAIVTVGGAEVDRRTVAIVCERDMSGGVRLAAQLTGTATPRVAEKAVRHLCAMYDDCLLVFVSNRSDLIETGHTQFTARNLAEDYPALYPCSKNSIVYAVDDVERIMMMDSLREIMADGMWREHSREALTQMEEVEATPEAGYTAAPGSLTDLVLLRAVMAHILTRELSHGA